jgi:hypothetical protein
MNNFSALSLWEQCTLFEDKQYLLCILQYIYLTTCYFILFSRSSNINVPGAWFFKIGRLNGGDIVQPDLNTGDGMNIDTIVPLV